MCYVWGRGEVGKPEGEKPRRRLRGSWEDNIIMDLYEIA